MRLLFFLSGFLATLHGTLAGAVHEVSNHESLVQSLRQLKDGDTVRIAPGEYRNGYSIQKKRNVTIEGSDPEKLPHFLGGSAAWHFSQCPDLVLRRVRCSGQTTNGINLDDGGPANPAATGIKLEDVHIEETGPDGNFDSIKCSGLDDLEIRRCIVKGWGGQAIDLVGCHRVLITGCRFEGRPGFSQHSGTQFKGGCSEIRLEDCRFLNAGQRPVQAGGSTGMAYFRPPGALYEARNITITRNRFEGGDCACAFTGVEGAEFSHNHIVFPAKWIFRILTETREEGFSPAKGVRIVENRILYRREQVSAAVNVGPHTTPDQFEFVGNQWYAQDRPQASKPALPVVEKDGVYGKPIEP